MTYSAFGRGLSDRPFDPAEFEVLPEDWLSGAPGMRLASVLVRVELMPDNDEAVLEKLEGWFVAESLAVSRAVDGAAIVAGDLRAERATRADVQLRLHRTVEGLSTVAISYCAVNLLAYAAYPVLENGLGLSKRMSLALLTPVVIFCVWLMVRPIRKHMD